MFFPIGTRLVLLGSNGFHLLAKFSLTLKILLFLGTKTFKMLLMTLVNDGRCSLEALPNLLTQFLANGTNLTIFLMEFLQLMEGADNIFFICQLLSSFTKLGLQLQILLEVILTGLAIQLEQIIELLNIQLIVTP